MQQNRVNELQRLLYWQGQKLLSRDFRDQAKYESELRWWHNRALHNAYGIAYGFGVTFDGTRVNVDCGVAYDCYGRELILQTPKEFTLPPAPKDFKPITLYASFAAPGEYNSCKDVSTDPLDCSSKQLAPSFQWKPARCWEFTDGVPLAEISYEPSAQLASLPANIRFPPAPDQKVFYDAERKLLIAIDGLNADEAEQLKKLSNEASFVAAVDKLVAKDERSPVLNAHFVARRARALTRPRIGSGSTVPGDTAWELWRETIVDLSEQKVPADLGFQVTIDTSGAGFTEVPHYFAWLQGTLWNRVHLNFFPVPIMHIDRESRSHFRVRLWMPSIITVLGTRVRFANLEPDFTGSTFSGTGDGTVVEERPSIKDNFVTDFVNFARQQQLYICWMGIQEMVQPQCEPFPDCRCDTVFKVPEQPVVGRVLRKAERRKRRAIRRRLIVEG